MTTIHAQHYQTTQQPESVRAACHAVYQEHKSCLIQERKKALNRALQTTSASESSWLIQYIFGKLNLMCFLVQEGKTTVKGHAYIKHAVIYSIKFNIYTLGGPRIIYTLHTISTIHRERTEFLYFTVTDTLPHTLKNIQRVLYEWNTDMINVTTKLWKLFKYISLIAAGQTKSPTNDQFNS